tara:strand:- start:1511 stop:1633 length:123 start_codon:yes stop_codon:yes gene_type:complete
MNKMMGEKEFFDIMKNYNRKLTRKERFQVVDLVKSLIEER